MNSLVMMYITIINFGRGTCVQNFFEYSVSSSTVSRIKEYLLLCFSFVVVSKAW